MTSAWDEERRYEAEQDAAYDAYLEELRQSIAKDWFEEELLERQTAVFRDSPAIARPSYAALTRAEGLLKIEPTASFLFSAISIEVALRKAFLIPLLTGIVHEPQRMASAIAQLVAPSIENAYSLLSELVDVDTPRPGVERKLWKEICDVMHTRNRVVHDAFEPERTEAEWALQVAQQVLLNRLPAALDKLGWHLHANEQDLCGRWTCRLQRIGRNQWGGREVNG